MGPKWIKFRQSSGKKVEVYSVRLPNGNLLILKRPPDGSQHVWTEVEPGTSDYKRWQYVAVDRPDPRGVQE